MHRKDHHPSYVIHTNLPALASIPDIPRTRSWPYPHLPQQNVPFQAATGSEEDVSGLPGRDTGIQAAARQARRTADGETSQGQQRWD